MSSSSQSMLFAKSIIGIFRFGTLSSYLQHCRVNDYTFRGSNSCHFGFYLPLSVGLSSSRVFKSGPHFERPMQSRDAKTVTKVF